MALHERMRDRARRLMGVRTVSDSNDLVTPPRRSAVAGQGMKKKTQTLSANHARPTSMLQGTRQYLPSDSGCQSDASQDEEDDAISPRTIRVKRKGFERTGPDTRMHRGTSDPVTTKERQHQGWRPDFTCGATAGSVPSPNVQTDIRDDALDWGSKALSESPSAKTSAASLRSTHSTSSDRSRVPKSGSVPQGPALPHQGSNSLHPSLPEEHQSPRTIPRTYPALTIPNQEPQSTAVEAQGLFPGRKRSTLLHPSSPETPSPCSDVPDVATESNSFSSRNKTNLMVLTHAPDDTAPRKNSTLLHPSPPEEILPLRVSEEPELIPPATRMSILLPRFNTIPPTPSPSAQAFSINIPQRKNSTLLHPSSPSSDDDLPESPLDSAIPQTTSYFPEEPISYWTLPASTSTLKDAQSTITITSLSPPSAKLNLTINARPRHGSAIHSSNSDTEDRRLSTSSTCSSWSSSSDEGPKTRRHRDHNKACVCRRASKAWDERLRLRYQGQNNVVVVAKTARAARASRTDLGGVKRRWE